MHRWGSAALSEEWGAGVCKAVVRYPFIFASQATAFDLATGLMPAGALKQIECIWEIIDRVLTQADSSLSEIVRCNYYVKRQEDTHAILRVCGRILADVRPAMTMVVVSDLPHPEALVSVDIIAMSGPRVLPSLPS